jgi:signal transduction histidine kinase
MMNLISNAIKFTEKGTINVRARVLENEDNLLVFSVTDTGIGIPADKIKTIFNRFKQVEDHNNRKHGGLGLGLSITKHLIELQGGNLTVESKIAEGSVFTVCMPFID